MQFDIKETLFKILFFHPWSLTNSYTLWPRLKLKNQSFFDYSKMVWAIFLKFLPLNKHKFVLIFFKNYDHCSIGLPATAHFDRNFECLQRLYLLRYSQKKKNWRGFRPYLVTPWKEFETSLKKRCFENFGTSQPSRSI